jgi:hypothetical protein
LEHCKCTSRTLAHPSRISLRVLAVNGQDPAIYQRFEAIGRPLPVTSVRLSTGPRGRWIDAPTNHLPTPAELPVLAGVCATCTYDPCVCSTTDAAYELLRDAEPFELDLDPEWSE